MQARGPINLFICTYAYKREQNWSWCSITVVSKGEGMSTNMGIESDLGPTCQQNGRSNLQEEATLYVILLINKSSKGEEMMYAWNN